MARTEEEREHISSYPIPMNVIENKAYLGGIVTRRKLVEAGIFCLFFSLLAKGIAEVLNLTLQHTFEFIIIFGGLAGAVGFIGINGDPLTVFFKKYLHYHQMKKFYSYLGEEALAEWEKTIMRQEEAYEKAERKEGKDRKQDTEISKEKKKSRRQIKKELAMERKQKAEAERIKASLIASGMDPVKVASLDVRKKTSTQKVKKISLTQQIKTSILYQKVEDVMEFYQSYRKRLEEEDIRKLPPVTTETVSFLPYKGMYSGIYETRDHRFVKFIEVKPTNFNLRSEREKDSIIADFFAYLRITPVNVQIKCVSRKVDTRTHVKKAKEYFEKESNEKCREMQMDTIRMLERMTESGSVEHKFYLIFEHETYGLEIEDKLKTMQILYEVCNDAVEYLQNCDLEVIEPENETNFAAKILYDQLNRKESIHEDFGQRKDDVAEYYMKTFQDPSQLSNIPIGELIAPKTIDFGESPKYYIIDGRYYTHFYLNGGSIAEEVYGGWTSYLINSGEGIDVDLFYTKKDKAMMINRMNLKIAFGGAGLVSQTSVSENYESDVGKIASSAYIRSGLKKGDEQDFYYVSVLITISADSEEELTTKIKSFQKKCTARKYVLENCNYMQDRAFLSSLPCCRLDPEIEKKAKRNMLTEGAASTFPFIANELSDDNGIVIGIDEVFRQLIILDLFNDNRYTNANVAMFGTSGAGKTYTLLLLAMRMRQQGIPIFIIAPLKAFEFKRSCAAIGGQYITISPASSQCINPLEIRLPDDSTTKILDGEDETIEMSALTQKIGMLKTLFTLIKPDITKKELNILDKALVQTYRKKGITHENGSLFQPGTKKYRAMPILGDVYDTIREMEPVKGEDLLDALEKFVYGSAKNFNQQTNVDLDNMYTVFDIEHLEKEILPVGMFIAIDFVFSKAKEDRTQKKAIIMDELWKLIGESRIAAQYVIEIFKIIRSYGGAAIAATQSSNDMKKLDDGKYGKEIVNCSSLKFILRLEKDEAVNIQDIFDFTDSEIYKIKKLKQGHCLLMFGENNVPVHVMATKKEHDLITTKRSDSERLMRMKQKQLEA